MTVNNSKISPHAQFGVPDPEWTAFYEKQSARVPQLEGSPQHLRDMMEKLKVQATKMIAPITDGLTTEDVQISCSDGGNIWIRIYTPTDGESVRPGLVYIHGGGWTLGDLEGEDIACGAICIQSRIVVISVDYRLAPENPFPRGLEDCWDALTWTLNQAGNLSIDTKRILIGGSSSGGNVTAVLAHRARDQGITLKGQILRIPATCHIDCYPPDLNLHSMEELKDAKLLSKLSMETFYGYYNPPDPSSPEVSPLLSSNFKGLAPAYVQVAGLDPLRDEGLAYADKLKQAGIPTHVDVYPGLPHAFWYFPDLSSAGTATKDLLNGISRLLDRN